MQVPHCNRTIHRRQRLRKTLSQLNHIDLTNCTKLTDTAIEHACLLPNIQRFTLRDCHDITSVAIDHIADAFYDTLTHLDMSCCYQFNSQDNAALGAALESFTKLKYLNMERCACGDLLLSHIGKMTTLEHLDIDMFVMSEVGLQRLFTLNQLQSLIVERATPDVVDLLCGAVARFFPHLRLLKISERRRRRKRMRMSLLRGCANLQVLDASGCEAMSDTNCQVVGKIRNLRSLTILGGDLNDVGLRGICSSSSQLTSLDIWNIEKLTDEGLSHLQNLHQLRKLQLHVNPAGEPLHAVNVLRSLSKLPLLTAIELHSFRGWCGECSVMLGSMLQLQSVSLNNIDDLTDDDLERVLTMLDHSVQQLTLYGCRLLTARCVDIVSSERQLRSLTMWCDASAGNCEALLRSRLPFLDSCCCW